jgi:hypothetical protein
MSNLVYSHCNINKVCYNKVMNTLLSRFALFTGISIITISLVTQTLASSTVLADSKPISTSETSTVTADALPTAQIDGVVLSQAIIGNTVYATGKFSTARPAGVALGGAGSVKRANLLAYDITTGILNTSFVHSLEGDAAEGRFITVSPDKTKIFVGGKFTAVDGKARANLVAFDAKTGAALAGYTGPNSAIKSMSATNTRLYVGGSFSTVGTAARKNLAAYNTTNGSLVTTWSATTNTPVSSVIVSPDGTKLIIGGAFTLINGQTFYGSGAVRTDTGASLPWASSSATYAMQNYDTATQSSSITHFSTNGSLIFVSAFSFKSPQSKQWMEGTAAINPANGAIVWMNDCHGDTYATFPQNGVLYSVSHAHDCAGMGGFPDRSHPNYNQFALAQSLTVSGTNSASTFNYPSKKGIAKTTLLNWYPRFTNGSVTNSRQAGWTITGNGTYLAIGGEFPTVSGKAQQGLVRFGPATVAPNKVGPTGYSAGVVSNSPVVNGSVTVTTPAAFDYDNRMLSYKFYRDAGTTPIKTISAQSTFWDRPTISFIDTNVPAGAHTYKVVVNDAFGNTHTGTTAPKTGCHPALGTVNTLCVGETLEINRSLYSENGKYQVKMQSDGNLVIYSGATAIWQSGTSGLGYARLRLESTNVLSVYLYDQNKVAWKTAASTRPALGLVMQNDGNLVMYDTSKASMWQSGTKR